MMLFFLIFYRGIRLIDNELNDIKNIQMEIKFLTNSDNRLEILHCLLKSPQTLKEIHEKTGLNNSSISINVSSLESKGYLINRNDVYYLTNASKIILTNLFYFNKSANFLDKNADFFNDYKLNNLQFNALKDMSSLESSQLVEATYTDIFRTVRIFPEFSVGSKSIKTIFPYVHPQIKDLLNYWFENDVEVKLILEEDVSKAFIELFEDFDYDGDSNCKILVKTVSKELGFVLGVIDEGIILGFNKEDGKFDQNAVFISKDVEAVIWGNEIFEEYEKLAPEYTVLKD